MTRRALIRMPAMAIAAAVLACALPAVAGATDYCVAPNAGCATGNNFQTLGDALAKADDATDADRILLGTWTYTAPAASGFVYDAPSSPVAIVGAGVGQTILTGPAGADSILELFGGDGTSVTDLTIRVPQNAASGVNGVWTDNTAKRIEVTEDPTQTNNFRKGLYLQDGGTLEDSKVTLGGPSGSIGVFLAGGHVRRSALTAITGAVTNNGSIERSGVKGYYTGVSAYGGVTSIASSRIAAGEDDGIYVHSYAGVAQTTVNADSVTIVGPGGVGKGVHASTDFDTGVSADVNLTNSVIRGFATALAASAPGVGQAKVTTSYSDYDPSANSTSGTNASISEANVTNVGDAGFVDAAGGDYRLLPGSPLVDAGDPATAQGVDLDGNPLVADGNADGTARRDLGAFELPAVPGPGPAGNTPAADTQAPLISGFRAAPSLFAIARAGTPLGARTPRGTSFRYMLSEHARVTLTIQRALAGRRAGGKCVRPSARLRKAKRCIRYRTVGALSRAGTSGSNSTRFTGRLRKRALRPGGYRALITATDTAGNRSAPRTTRFRVVGR